MTSPSAVSTEKPWRSPRGRLTKSSRFRVSPSEAVYQDAGGGGVRAQIRRLPAGVGGVPHLVLHRVRLLHRGPTGIAGGLAAHHQIWEVGEREQEETRVSWISNSQLLTQPPPHQETMFPAQQLRDHRRSRADAPQQNRQVLRDYHGGAVHLRHQLR